MSCSQNKWTMDMNALCVYFRINNPNVRRISNDNPVRCLGFCKRNHDSGKKTLSFREKGGNEKSYNISPSIQKHQRDMELCKQITLRRLRSRFQD